MSTKNKIWLGAALTVIILGVILFLVLKPRQIKQEPEKSVTREEPQALEELKASDIGLEALPRSDNQAINITISKLSGIASLDYELDYLAQGNIPRGVIGTINIKPEDKNIKREILLGTCSANVCKYDKGVKEVTLIFKITYTDGRTGTLQEKISL